MTTIFKPLYATAIPITIVLNSLANNAIVLSDPIDLHSVLYEEGRLRLNIAGTAAATAWLDIRLLASIDGGTTYDTWESGTPLPALYLAVTPQVYSERFFLWEYFKIGVQNKTGAALAGSGNSASLQGLNMQGV